MPSPSMPDFEAKYNELISKQKQAQKKYYEKNKEKIISHNKQYYTEKLKNDTEYINKKREYNKKRYLEKKSLGKNNLEI